MRTSSLVPIDLPRRSDIRHPERRRARQDPGRAVQERRCQRRGAGFIHPGVGALDRNETSQWRNTFPRPKRLDFLSANHSQHGDSRSRF